MRPPLQPVPVQPYPMFNQPELLYGFRRKKNEVHLMPQIEGLCAVPAPPGGAPPK